MQILLENYLLELKNTTNPNSIPSKFQGIKHFCIMNQITINWNIIQKMFPPKQKTQSLRAYTQKEIKKFLSNSNNSRDIALIHFLASTGARIGVFDHTLCIKHIKKMPHNCTAVKLYADEIEEYWAFLTPQATKALNRYHDTRKKNGEVFLKDTSLFTQLDSTRPLAWNGLRSIIYRIITKSITRSKYNGRYDVQTGHGFRKRFNTILKLDNSVNYNIAEKLMGHKNGLDGIYFTPTISEMFAEFRKIMYKLQV